MRRAVDVICLMFLLTVVLLFAAAPSCEAQPNFINVRIHLDRNLPNGEPEVYVFTPGNRFVGVCRGETPEGPGRRHCEGNQFRWNLTVQGNPLEEGEEVFVKNAPDHPQCFGVDPVHTFNHSNQNEAVESGEPAAACADPENKHGTYWPYIIEYFKDGKRLATTDPGAIIFP